MRRPTWHGVWCLGLAAVTTACAETAFRVSGTVLGHDSKPIALAHVALLVDGPSAAAAAVVQAGADGAFNLTIGRAGLVSLRFTGVDHAPETVPLLIAELDGSAEVNVRLAVPAYADNFSRVAVIGDFNEFRADDTAVRLTPTGDGRFAAQVAAGTGGTVAYQVINATEPTEGINSTYPGPPIPGTAADRYVLRDDGRYATVLKAAGPTARIVFSPAPLPRDSSAAAVTIKSNGRETERFAEFATTTRREVQEYTRRRLELKYRGATNDEVMAFVRHYDWDRVHRPIRSVLAGPGSALLKQAAMVLYLSEAGELAEISHSPLDPAVMQQALQEVPPSSPLWASASDAFQALTWANFHAPVEGYTAYFEQITTTHPNRTLRESILSYDLSVASYAGDAEREAGVYERLLEDFPDSRATAVARKMLASDRRIVAGRPVPDFRVASLDDPAVVYSRASLLGRVYLIDFWAVWCGPCMAEMPHLHQASERYKDTGFTILSLSCDESAEKVRQFRRERWPMPWLQGFLERCYRDRDRNDLVTAFEVVGFPSAVLVGADGTILEAGSALRGDRLAATLARVLGGAETAGAR